MDLWLEVELECVLVSAGHGCTVEWLTGDGGGGGVQQCCYFISRFLLAHLLA